jgi:5'-3' exonuclease
MDYIDQFKDVTVFFDFNNLAIRNYMGNKDIWEDETNIQWGLWRYNCINSIMSTLWKIKNVTEVIVAVDDKHQWRKSFYNRYKESRKKNKKKSSHDWNLIYKHINILAADLKHYFPFKLLKVKSAEADDIIAILVKKMDNDNIIVARDEDYFQLFAQRKNLRILDPLKQVLYTPEDIPDVKDFLLSLIFCGQKKDDIPNIITPDNWGLTEETEGKRRPGFGKVKWDKIKHDMKGFIEAGYVNKAYGLVNLSKNLKRNRILVDFDMIPKTIVNRIVDAYNHSDNLPPSENIYLFFEKNNMRSFLDNIHKVETKLMPLY